MQVQILSSVIMAYLPYALVTALDIDGLFLCYAHLRQQLLGVGAANCLTGISHCDKISYNE